MKRILLAFLALALGLADAEATVSTFTNATGAIQVRGWKRFYVYGLGDGTLSDPSGKIASYAQGAAVGATTRQLSEIADAARLAASNQLARMYAVTNLLETFTKKIFVNAVLYPDLASQSNCWGRTVREWTDGTNDHCMVYFSRQFTVAPTIKRRYCSELHTNIVEGVWTDFSAEGVMVDGYEGCKEIVYTRPDNFVLKNTFPNPYFRFGTEDQGFDFGNSTYEIDGQLYYTGSWTNALGKVWWFNNGAKVREESDVEE